MAEHNIPRWLGLMLDQSQLALPPGALAAATNCVIDRHGLIQPRYGYASADTLSGYDDCFRLWMYQGRVMGHVKKDSPADWRLVYSDADGTTFTAIDDTNSGDLKHPMGNLSVDFPNYHLKPIEVNEYLYLTEKSGIRRTGAYDQEPVFAGTPRMPDIDRYNSSLTTDATGVLPTETKRAYRAVLYFLDGDRKFFGAPSGRCVILNTDTTNAKRPTIRVRLPKQNGTASTALTTAYWVQLYASSVTPDLATECFEDFALVYEHNLTSTNISNGYVDLDDTTPDALRGSALYTNPTQETALWAKMPPPFAYTGCAYKGCLLLANVAHRARLELTILAVGGTYGIQDTDTLTISDGTTSFTVTAKTSPTTDDHYKLDTDGTSASDKLANTAQNLCSAINRYSSNTLCYAYYAGTSDDPRSVGKVIVEARLATTSYLGAYVGTGDKRNCWEPQLPETSLGNVKGYQDAGADSWALSIPGEPDAFPLLNSGRLGAPGYIVQVEATDDAAFLFLDSGEIWVMTGEPPTSAFDPGTLRVEPWRRGVRLLAPETVRPLDGRLIGLFDRGVCALSPAGLDILSDDVRDALLDAVAICDAEGIDYPSLSSMLFRMAFAAVDPVNGRYILSIPTASNSTQCDAQWVVQLRPGAPPVWTKWGLSTSCMTFDNTVGNGCLWFSEISSASLDFYKMFARSNRAHTDAAGNISCTVTTPPIAIGNGRQPKQLREVLVAFEANQPSSLTATITTEHTNASVTVATQSTGLARIPVPTSVQRGVRHTISLAIASTSNWKMGPTTLLYAPAEKGTK